jgi:hypothetical protein
VNRRARAAGAALAIALVALASEPASAQGAAPAAPQATPPAKSGRPAPRSRAKKAKRPRAPRLAPRSPTPRRLAPRALRPGRLAPQPVLARPPAWLEGSAPTGWTQDARLAGSVGTALLQSSPFGQVSTKAGAVAYVNAGVAAFYLSWLEATDAAPKPADALRGALDQLRESRLASSSEPSSTEELRYDERVAGRTATAELEWRHLPNQTLSLVRGFAWATTDGKPRLGVAECVVGTTTGKAPPDVEKACRQALASVAVAAPPAEQSAIAALPATRVGAADNDPAPQQGERAGGTEPPTIGPAPAKPGVLYRGPEPVEERSAARWIILFGAALLVAALLLNMRANRRRAADEAAAPPAPEAEAELEPKGEDANGRGEPAEADSEREKKP